MIVCDRISHKLPMRLYLYVSYYSHNTHINKYKIYIGSTHFKRNMKKHDFDDVCVCGVCSHRISEDCKNSECACCLNFHIRSGITETA